MFYVYIIYSSKTDRFYTGYTDEDVPLRVQRHNLGWTKSTKTGIPWNLVYTESYPLKADALIREREIKKKKSRKYIEFLIRQTKS